MTSYAGLHHRHLLGRESVVRLVFVAAVLAIVLHRAIFGSLVPQASSQHLSKMFYIVFDKHKAIDVQEADQLHNVDAVHALMTVQWSMDERKVSLVGIPVIGESWYDFDIVPMRFGGAAVDNALLDIAKQSEWARQCAIVLTQRAIGAVLGSDIAERSARTRNTWLWKRGVLHCGLYVLALISGAMLLRHRWMSCVSTERQMVGQCAKCGYPRADSQCSECGHVHA